jgi:hypothetical protein
MRWKWLCGRASRAHHGAIENDPHDLLVGQRAGVPRVPPPVHPLDLAVDARPISAC